MTERLFQLIIRVAVFVSIIRKMAQMKTSQKPVRQHHVIA